MINIHCCEDTRYKIQDTRYKIQDTRYKIQDTRYKIQDTRYKIQDKDTRYKIKRMEDYVVVDETKLTGDQLKLLFQKVVDGNKLTTDELRKMLKQIKDEDTKIKNEETIKERERWHKHWEKEREERRQKQKTEWESSQCYKFLKRFGFETHFEVITYALIVLMMITLFALIGLPNKRNHS